MVASIPTNLCLHKHLSIARDPLETHLLVGRELLSYPVHQWALRQTNCTYILRGGL